MSYFIPNLTSQGRARRQARISLAISFCGAIITALLTAHLIIMTRTLALNFAEEEFSATAVSALQFVTINDNLIEPKIARNEPVVNIVEQEIELPINAIAENFPVEKTTTRDSEMAYPKESEISVSANENNAQVAAEKSSSAGTRTAPQIINGANRPPVYPEMARRKNQRGTVILQLQIDERGKVSAVEIAQSSGYSLLDNAAAKAAQAWKYYPGSIDGKATVDSLKVPVEFRLQ